MMKKTNRVPIFLFIFIVLICFAVLLEYNVGLQHLYVHFGIENVSSRLINNNSGVRKLGDNFSISEIDMAFNKTTKLTSKFLNGRLKEFLNGRLTESDKGLQERKPTKSENLVLDINEKLLGMVKEFNNQAHCDLSNEERYIVISQPLGRLGNLMFQFASVVGIATKLHIRFVISPNHPILKFFAVDQFVLHRKPTNLIVINEHLWLRRTLSGDYKWMCHNISIRGNLQNYKYFSHIQKIVRNMFVFHSHKLRSAKEYLLKAAPYKHTKIGIHVRRGDFLQENLRQEGRVVASVNYIRKAMSFYRRRYRNVHFVVCSDDISWCKENIHSPDVTFSESKEPITDMAILSLCDHSIITVGTFSWWAGFLSGGTVVYLNDYPVPGSYLDHFAPRDVYYPPYWIGMSNA